MTAPDKQEPPHRWKAFLDSLPSAVSQRLSAHDIRHIFRYFDTAKPKSGEVVPSIKFTTYTDGRGFRACIGDYDLDCLEGHGKTPLEAIQDLLNSHIDDLEE